jgi:hypothetical protein
VIYCFTFTFHVFTGFPALMLSDSKGLGGSGKVAVAGGGEGEWIVGVL